MKVTSKGRVIVSRMRAGDHLSFDEEGKGVRVNVVRREPVQEIQGYRESRHRKRKKGHTEMVRELRGE